MSRPAAPKAPTAAVPPKIANDRFNSFETAFVVAFKKIDSLEKFIRNELLPRIGGLPQKPISAPVDATPPPSPPHPPSQIPGLGLDVSRALRVPENAGVVRERVNEALKEMGIKCIGVNDKGNGRYRLLFRKSDDVDKVHQDDSWLKGGSLKRARLYGEQWYPIRIDRVHKNTSVDENGQADFGRLNGVIVYKIRWLGTFAPVGQSYELKERIYCSIVMYLDSQDEASKLLINQLVIMS